MKTVLVLGNGGSRLTYDLASLRRCGRIYGCNALYRDFSPDVLVAIDRQIADEIVASGYSRDNTCFFAADDRANPIPARCLVGEYGKTQYSGPTAVRLAVHLDNPDQVFLVGFDIVDLKWSNVYAGTPGYADFRQQAARVVAAGQKVLNNPLTLTQLRDIFLEFPRVQFYKVMDSNCFRYSPWRGIANLTYLKQEEFIRVFATAPSVE